MISYLILIIIYTTFFLNVKNHGLIMTPKRCVECMPLPSGTRRTTRALMFWAFSCGLGRFPSVLNKDGRYVVARDPVGIIPLYIGWGSDGSVQVASELKALHKVQPWQPWQPGNVARIHDKQIEIVMLQSRFQSVGTQFQISCGPGICRWLKVHEHPELVVKSCFCFKHFKGPISL